MLGSEVQSVVAIGPFSILQLTGRSASPFNVQHAVPNASFSQRELVEFFSVR
jgi:hypothetical protein